MYFFAYGLLLIGMLCALGSGGLALLQLWQGRSELLSLVEKAQLVLAAALLVASAFLLHALYWHDFRCNTWQAIRIAFSPCFTA